MKTLPFLLALFAISPPAHAQESCSGELNTPGGFVNGTCSAGSCSAFLSSSFLNGTAECDGGVSAQAQGYTQGGYVSGQCLGGSISLFLPSDRYELSGSCSNGHQFSGDAESFGGYANGTCTVNGSFNVFLSGGSVSFRGECR